MNPVAVWSILTGAFVWELAGRWAGWQFLPPLSGVLRAGVELAAAGEVLSHLVVSLTGLIAGYGAAVVVGVAIGGLMGRYRAADDAFGPYVSAFLAAPKIALVPLLYAVLGLSAWVQVAVVFLSAVFIVIVNTARGVQTAGADCAEMAKAFGATEHQLFWKVLLPGSLPLTMAGLRLAVGHAVKGMINGEMFLTLFGMGGLLRTYGSRFDAEKVFAILLMVIAVGLICSLAIEALERRLTHWTGPALAK